MQLNSLTVADWQARRLRFSLRCAAVAAGGSFGFSLLATSALDPCADHRYERLAAPESD